MRLSLVPKKYRTTPAERARRLKICLGCEDLIKLTKQCKHCLCFVRLKTYLKNEHCAKPRRADRKW